MSCKYAHAPNFESFHRRYRYGSGQFVLDRICCFLPGSKFEARRPDDVKGLSARAECDVGRLRPAVIGQEAP